MRFERALAEDDCPLCGQAVRLGDWVTPALINDRASFCCMGCAGRLRDHAVSLGVKPLGVVPREWRER